MRSGPKEAGRLVTEGGALFTRFFASPVPVVVACTGHAIAAGALLLLGADYRVGAAGEFRIGLIETQTRDGAAAVGDRVQRGAAEPPPLPAGDGRARGSTTPTAAVDAGFLDATAPPDQVLAATLEEAERWAALPRAAYAGQVTMNRGARIAALEAAVAADHNLVFDVPA